MKIKLLLVGYNNNSSSFEKYCLVFIEEETVLFTERFSDSGIVYGLEEPVGELLQLLGRRLRFFLESQVLLPQGSHLLRQVGLLPGLAVEPGLEQVHLLQQLREVPVLKRPRHRHRHGRRTLDRHFGGFFATDWDLCSRAAPVNRCRRCRCKVW